MNKNIYKSVADACLMYMNGILKNYWEPIYEYLKNKPDLIKTVPGFLVYPKEIILYFGKTHLGIEYIGEERIKTLPDNFELTLRVFDYTESTDNFLEKIIGFQYNDSSTTVSIPIISLLEDLIMPTNRGFDKLNELNWNFGVQDSITFFNCVSPKLVENEFSRIVNGLFFDANEHGLQTRHIKWIDFIPAHYDNSNPEFDSFSIDFSGLKNLVEHDCQYIYSLPTDYDFIQSKLQKINRFIELIGNNTTIETDITNFLSLPENQFILTMRFGATSILNEVKCEWQSETKDPIKPDFIVIQPNGFGDIVEFKLPSTEFALVGSDNRETFSAKINSYISQTRVYGNFFNDPNNRKWFEENYHNKVHNPKRILIIGRRWQFDDVTWKEILADYQNLEIMNYDDLLDGVIAQLYL